MRRRKWGRFELEFAAKNSTSTRQVLKKLRLVEAGGNYSQIKKYFKEYAINTSHFKGMAWNKGLKYNLQSVKIEDVLVKNSSYQSYKLKQRLFKSGYKKQQCEECNWAKKSEDGRIPLELDHINGDNKDNRLENLRVLCPNCHSLKLTHRGCNKRK